MRYDLRAFDVLRPQSHRLISHGSAAAENICWHRSCCCGFVSVTDITKLGDVRDGGNICNVSDVRDIYWTVLASIDIRLEHRAPTR